MDLNYVINLLRNEGIEGNEAIRRLSPITNYEKWEPSFLFENGDIQLKIRKIRDKNKWKRNEIIVRQINEVNPDCLPEIIHVDEGFVITHYIKGKELTLDETDLTKLGEVFYSFHITSREAEIKAGLVLDNVAERLSLTARKNVLHIERNNLLKLYQITRVKETLSRTPRRYTLGFTHGDLAIRNIVKTKEAKYRIMDLEGLQLFLIEYDFVKPLQDIFYNQEHIMINIYGSMIEFFQESRKYWETFYLVQKIVERDSMNRPNGIKRAIELIDKLENKL